MLAILKALAEHWGFTIHEHETSVNVSGIEGGPCEGAFCCTNVHEGKEAGIRDCIEFIRDCAKTRLSNDKGIHPTGTDRYPMVSVDIASTRKTVGMGKALLTDVDCHHGIRKYNRTQQRGWKARGKKRKQWMKGR